MMPPKGWWALIGGDYRCTLSSVNDRLTSFLCHAPSSPVTIGPRPLWIIIALRFDYQQSILIVLYHLTTRIKCGQGGRHHHQKALATLGSSWRLAECLFFSLHDRVTSFLPSLPAINCRLGPALKSYLPAIARSPSSMPTRALCIFCFSPRYKPPTNASRRFWREQISCGGMHSGVGCKHLVYV